MAFVFKSIIPKDMDIDVFRLEYLNELRKEARTITKEYKKTTRTWKNKPKFVTQIGLSRIAGDASVLVGTDDEQYRWVDEGTRAHIIRARNAPSLAFQTGFRPKTRSKVISSRKGGRSGPIVRPKVVRHPGTKARLFSETIAKKRTAPFERNIRRANKRAADKVFK